MVQLIEIEIIRDAQFKAVIKQLCISTLKLQLGTFGYCFPYTAHARSGDAVAECADR